MAHTASLSQLQTPPWALVNGEFVGYKDVRISIGIFNQWPPIRGHGAPVRAA